MTESQVAVIGAGLCGLTLAVALAQVGIPCTVYESRSAPLNIGGAVMLSPNALKILDALGLYDHVRSNGYNFELLDFERVDGTHVDTYEFGSATKYGYEANRVYRHELIDSVLAKAKASGAVVQYGRKFSHVVEETNEGVTFEFADGSRATTSMLVGADGIHSIVRKYLYPELEPRYVGLVGMTSAVPASQITFPKGKPISQPLTIMHPELGAFVLAPQKVDGSEYLIGKQKHVPEQTREGWDKVHADKAAAVEFIKSNAEAFGPIAVSATSDVPEERVNIWPFYMIPKLDKWVSEKRHVVILGDSAHALPPSAGQGINQGYEDVYMFSLLLAEVNRAGSKVNFEAAISFWQQYRQSRIDKVLVLNRKIDLRRMPADARPKDLDPKELEEKFELSWLYEPDFKGIVDDWVKTHST